jgi:4-amino-4-deoxy-L-arabinose transferase-like glycosyltransferase
MKRFVSLPACFVITIAAGLYLYRLGDRDLWSSHEARAAQDAQSIIDGQSSGLPKLFDRHLDLQKPPLYYWLVAGVAVLRGSAVDAWAVRLPAALAGLAGVWFLFGLCFKRNRPAAGIMAGLMLGTMLHYTWLARTGRIDMALTAATTAALVCFYLGQKRLIGQVQLSTVDGPEEQTLKGLSRARTHWQPSPFRAEKEEGPLPPGRCPGLTCLAPSGRTRTAGLHFVGLYLALAVAVLLKGPIGVLLPGITIVLYLLSERQLPMPWQIRRSVQVAHCYGLWWGVPLLLGLTLPWFLWENQLTAGEFFHVFFVKHNMERGLGGGDLAARPLWFYGPHLLVDTLPWSLLLPAAFWLFRRRPEYRADAEARFGMVWFLTMTATLSCFQFKRADYLLPAYPGVALFLGSIAERWYCSLSARRTALACFSGTIAACLVGWYAFIAYVLPQYEPELESRTFAALVRKVSPAPQLVLFFRAEAHALAFHVGRPIDTILEWENLDAWVGRPQVYHVIMPADEAARWKQHLKSGWLREVARLPRESENSSLFDRIVRHGESPGTLHAQPLVLLRSHPGSDTTE